MASAITGTATGSQLNSTSTVTVPDNGDDLNAESVESNSSTPKTGFLGLLNYAELFRKVLRGEITGKAFAVDGTGGASVSTTAGDISASHDLIAGNNASATALVTGGTGVTATTGYVKGPRFQASGTAVSGSNFALGTGWGNTASVFVASGSCDTAGSITVTAGGVGIAADPRIIFTFSATYPAHGGIQIVQMVDNDESSNSGPIYPVVIKNSLTAPQWFMIGTPVTGHLYTFNWITLALV